MILQRLTRWGACAVALALFHPSAQAGDQTVMHCFAWTPVKEATPADWQSFYKASDALPHKIKGILRVWYGKLVAPLGQAQLGDIDNATFHTYTTGAPVTIPVKRIAREYGMCMEMKNADVLKAYDTDPYHKLWTEAYAKVRVEGTTTFNILGQ